MKPIPDWRSVAVGCALLAWLLAPRIADAVDPSSLNWAPVDAAVRGQVAATTLPGVVLVFGDAQHVWLRRAWGNRSSSPRQEAMTPDTVFDVASLTKVIVTTTAILQLAERRRLSLDQPVARYWPAFGAQDKDGITIRQLLSHTSGLRADLDLRADWVGRQEAMRRVLAERPMVPVGTRVLYSDINFIVLGELVERLSGLSLQAYADRFIFKPLGMRDSGYLPAADRLARSAPTGVRDGAARRGMVHDPTARRMGGVAGHAGLFSTADDLARFAQSLLRGRGVLSPESITALRQPQGPPDAPEPRGLGWQLFSPMVANRDELAPGGAIGHTGFTGTAIWVDFSTGRFAVLLSNRVYPDGRGDARPLRRQVLALLSSLSPPMNGAPSTPQPPRGPVTLGIDVLREQDYSPLRGARVGLITHLAAVDSQGWRTIDRLRWAPGVNLVRLFTPEHGLYSDVEGIVPSGFDPFSGIPVVSLYGKSRRPDPIALSDIDVLVVDLQDAGARFFTYASTVAEMMEVAAERHLKMLVLDRPDPVRADRFAGPVLDAGKRSFTGQADLPTLPGMTIGELAHWLRDDLQDRRGVGVDLQVIAMQGYRRSMWFDQTGLDWIPPSPNLRTLRQTILYSGVAWIEGANISVGRGTEHPFEQLGAPWINAQQLANALNEATIPGLRFDPVAFIPAAGPYRGMTCHGVSLELLDRNLVDTAVLGTQLARVIERLWPEKFRLEAIEPLIGSRQTMDDLARGTDMARIFDGWQPALLEFNARRSRYLLY